MDADSIEDFKSTDTASTLTNNVMDYILPRTGEPNCLTAQSSGTSADSLPSLQFVADGNDAVGTGAWDPLEEYNGNGTFGEYEGPYGDDLTEQGAGRRR